MHRPRRSPRRANCAAGSSLRQQPQHQLGALLNRQLRLAPHGPIPPSLWSLYLASREIGAIHIEATSGSSLSLWLRIGEQAETSVQRH